MISVCKQIKYATSKIIIQAIKYHNLLNMKLHYTRENKHKRQTSHFTENAKKRAEKSKEKVGEL